MTLDGLFIGSSSIIGGDEGEEMQWIRKICSPFGVNWQSRMCSGSKTAKSTTASATC